MGEEQLVVANQSVERCVACADRLSAPHIPIQLCCRNARAAPTGLRTQRAFVQLTEAEKICSQRCFTAGPPSTATHPCVLCPADFDSDAAWIEHVGQRHHGLDLYWGRFLFIAVRGGGVHNCERLCSGCGNLVTIGSRNSLLNR